MEATLFGDSKDPEVSKILQILQDAGAVFVFEDMKHIDSPLYDAVEVLSNSKELPVLFHKGVCVVGAKAVRNYIGEVL